MTFGDSDNVDGIRQAHRGAQRRAQLSVLTPSSHVRQACLHVALMRECVMRVIAFAMCAVFGLVVPVVAAGADETPICEQAKKTCEYLIKEYDQTKYFFQSHCGEWERLKRQRSVRTTDEELITFNKDQCDYWTKEFFARQNTVAPCMCTSGCTVYCSK